MHFRGSQQYLAVSLAASRSQHLAAALCVLARSVAVFAVSEHGTGVAELARLRRANVLYVPPDDRRRELGPQAYVYAARVRERVQAARYRAAGLADEQIGSLQQRGVERLEAARIQRHGYAARDAVNDLETLRIVVAHPPQPGYTVRLQLGSASLSAEFYTAALYPVHL